LSKVKCEKLYSKEAGCGSWKASRGPKKAGQGRRKVGRGHRKVGRGRRKVGRGRRKVGRGRKKVDRGRKKVDHGRRKVGRGRRKVGRGLRKVGRGRRKVRRGRKNVGRGRRKVNISQLNRKKRCKCYYKWFYTLKTFIFSGLCGVKVESRCSGAGAPSSSPFGRSAKKFFLKESLRKYKSYQVCNFISSAAMAQLAKQATGMQQQST